MISVARNLKNSCALIATSCIVCTRFSAVKIVRFVFSHNAHFRPRVENSISHGRPISATILEMIWLLQRDHRGPYVDQIWWWSDNIKTLKKVAKLFFFKQCCTPARGDKYFWRAPSDRAHQVRRGASEQKKLLTGFREFAIKRKCNFYIHKIKIVSIKNSSTLHRNIHHLWTKFI